MSKNYTFSDCVDYAYKHNICFTLMRNIISGDNEVYAYISDANDGYITATYCSFTWNYFYHRWQYDIDLNTRYAFKKDYELARRLAIALSSHSETHKHIQPNTDSQLWYGPLTFNNEHYIASAFIGDNKW